MKVTKEMIKECKAIIEILNALEGDLIENCNGIKSSDGYIVSVNLVYPEHVGSYWMI